MWLVRRYTLNPFISLSFDVLGKAQKVKTKEIAERQNTLIERLTSENKWQLEQLQTTQQQNK